ncbi:GATA-type zinc finger protein 1 isoform X4 [Paramormyrops kingsleyae]|uniref:Zinc finger GATA like protein 1 n=1 Tax=Paramormyrops kingsleyae TaxID=1676925 RepID=A0A3B3SE10_9TELE|nr:GATA-type zinc finger protein 1 isoform X4 [Paramormyrops kingsleyae]
MSTGSDTPATLSEGTREDLDVQDDQVPQSTILYLLQEATKLAPPAKQDTLEWRLTNGTCSKEQSQQYPSSPVASAYCPPVPSVQPCKYVETTPKSQQKYSGSFSFIQSQQGSSPWEVMSLINLQCERLLHPVSEDGEEGRETPLLPTSGHKSSVGYLRGDTIPDRTRDQSEFQEVGKHAHSQSVRNKTVKSEPWCFRTMEEEVRPIGESSPDLSFYNERSSKVSHSSTLVQSSVFEGENEQCPIIYPEDTQEDGKTHFSTNDTESHINEQRPGSPSEELSRDFHTVNRKSAPVKDTSSSPGNAHRSNRDDATLRLVDPQVAKVAVGPSWRGRTPRKQRHPTRSADLCDPDFQGVSFRMRTEFSDNRDQCRLLITSKYSAEFWKSGRRGRGSRMRSLINSLKTSSSEEDIDPVSVSKNKTCASCNTKTTPLWRDAEDGTPLCNACGIRYKKYRVRCHQCWYIPRKEGNSNSRCSRCGDMLRLACSHRKNSKDLAMFTAT